MIDKKIIEELKKINAKRVLIQFPEGLTLKIQEIAKKLEKNGFETVICMEKTFGACDVRDVEAKRIGCDVILHIGHEKFVESTDIPVVYWEYFIDADPIPILKKEIGKLEKMEKIGLITSIQFVKTIPVVKKFLEKNGKKVYVHKSLHYPGQVLGCNLEAAKAIEDSVDCFLCISAGEFYANGIVMITKKPVLNLDMEKREIYNLEDLRKRVEKTIIWNLSNLEDAKRVGILISWKKGQIYHNYFDLKKKLEKSGKEVFILAMDEITPEKIEGLKLDALINCACPRIGIDDLKRYKVPIININFISD